MKVKFNKKYKEDTRWVEVLVDFLEELSKAYGHPIDEYDMIRVPCQVKIDKLGKLINNKLMYKEGEGLFIKYIQRDIRLKAKACVMREQDIALSNALRGAK